MVRFGFWGLGVFGISLLVGACAPGLTVIQDNTGGAGGGGSVASSSSASGAGGNMGTPCKVDADCAVMETECHKNGTCVNDFCVSNDPPEGTLLKEQIYGDCLDIVCDGNGGVNTMKQNMTDKYDWGNSCYKDTCGTMPLVNIGAACTTNWDKPGNCGLDFRCGECAVNGACVGADVCDFGRCVPPTCKNGMLDAGETDVDCGGSCFTCAPGLKCSVASDCQGHGSCTGNPKTCQAPACDDGLKNGDETDLDCGGSCASDPNVPKKCANNLKCLLPTDCTSGHCKIGECQ